MRRVQCERKSGGAGTNDGGGACRKRDRSGTHHVETRSAEGRACVVTESAVVKRSVGAEAVTAGQEEWCGSGCGQW
jgi:hypothetical protein